MSRTTAETTASGRNVNAVRGACMTVSVHPTAILSGGERIKFTADIGPYVPPRHVVPDEVIYDGIMQ